MKPPVLVSIFSYLSAILAVLHEKEGRKVQQISERSYPVIDVSPDIREDHSRVEGIGCDAGPL